MKKKINREHINLYATVFLLVIIDQLIKCVISTFFLQTESVLIPGLLSFKPVHNTELSWFGSLGIKLFSNYFITVGINLFIFIAAVILYRYVYLDMVTSRKSIQLIFIFLFAATLCSTIDRIFWRGSLDYIRLEGFFIFDIKDCYVTIFVILFIISYFKNREEMKRINLKNILKGSFRKEGVLMKNYTTILFDLDGTLTDPWLGITTCVQYALNAFGVEDVPLENLTKFIGPPLKESFMEYYGFDADQAELAVEKYRERFHDTGIFENKVYLGIPELLTSIRDAGKRLAVASSKPEVFVVRILEHFDLAGYFEVVKGSHLDGRRTKKSEVIEAALEELKFTDRSKVLMVGDRLHDVEGAKEAGLDCAGVTFGYGGFEELEAAGATYIVDTPEALEALILGKNF